MIAIPKIMPVADLVVTEPEIYRLDNGIEIFGFNGGANEVIKLDVVFSAGRWAEQLPLSAGSTAALIKSGTQSTSAFELEEKIDFLGSTIKAASGYNGFTLSLYCMTRHLEASLSIFKDVLLNGQFPEKEINIYKENSLARLKINSLKNDYVGDMVFKEALFGSEHPYGYQTTASRINGINREALQDYYHSNLTSGNCFMGLAGRFDETHIELINQSIGEVDSWTSKSKEISTPEWTEDPSTELKIVKQLQDSVQASIYIGNKSLKRTEKDFHALSFLNLIYGGYFGSRLMKNIREDKGMTYGIYSYIQQYKFNAAFIINTETAVEHVDACLNEIYAEMERLKQQKIGEKELGQARNYMMGRLLDQVDGPFKSAGTFMSLKSHDIPLAYIHQTVSALNELDSELLLDTAQKYFDKKGMYEVVVK